MKIPTLTEKQLRRKYNAMAKQAKQRKNMNSCEYIKKYFSDTDLFIFCVGSTLASGRNFAGAIANAEAHCETKESRADYITLISRKD